MHLLNEHLGTIAYDGDRSAAFAAVSGKLRTSGITILEEDENAGRIVARCLSRLSNLMVWRCWSDKLLVQFENADRTANIRVYAIPNLFRFGVKKGDREINPSSLLAEIRRSISAIPTFR